MERQGSLLEVLCVPTSANYPPTGLVIDIKVALPLCANRCGKFEDFLS